MTFEQFEHTEYYQNFLRKFNLYHELGIYLFDNKTIIGGMALVRSKHEQGFNSQDIRKLEAITSHIAYALSINVRLRDYEIQNRVTKALLPWSITGLILFDESFKIHYRNTAAIEILKYLSPSLAANGLKITLQNLLPEQNSLWQLGLLSKLLI